jgi:hypothetical protein
MPWDGFKKYPIKSIRIRWEHVWNEQWHAHVEGTIDRDGKEVAFRFPEHNGSKYPISGREDIQRFVEGWAKNKNLVNIFELEAA